MKLIVKVIAIVAVVHCTVNSSFAQSPAIGSGIENSLIQACDSPDPGNEDHYE